MYNTNYYNRPYLPQGYQQQYTQYQYPNYNIMQQQYMQPQMQQMQPMDMPITDLKFLTADQIRGFIPPINSKVMLIDKANGLAYIETTDSMGNFSKDVYSFALAKENSPTTQQNTEGGKFITSQELDGLKSEINELKKQLSQRREANDRTVVHANT